MSFCHSRAAGELIRLSGHLSLRFGPPVDLPVIVGCLKLIRLSTRLSHRFCRLSCRLTWPFTQLGGADANKHTRKAGYFHAAGELIFLSARLSLNIWFDCRFACRRRLLEIGSHFVPPVMP